LNIKTHRFSAARRTAFLATFDVRVKLNASQPLLVGIFLSKNEESKTEYVLTEKRGGVLWLTLNRQDRMNSFNKELIDAVSAAIDEADADDEVRCILIKGAGERAFCAGADISMFKDLDEEALTAASEMGQSLMSKIEASFKPSVAAIHGYCLGGGLELALACDFRIAAESASLGSPEIGLGLITGWGATQRLPRLLGLARAKELVLLGGRIKGDEAHKIGLIHKVVPLESLYEEAEALAEKLAAGPPLALKAAKKALNEGGGMPLKDGFRLEAEMFGSLAGTEDLAEGISAFFERRKAEFKGK